jgi:hypothetical protein
VEAVWDYDIDDWRQDFVSTVRDLAPDVIRFGHIQPLLQMARGYRAAFQTPLALASWQRDFYGNVTFSKDESIAHTIELA